MVLVLVPVFALLFQGYVPHIFPRIELLDLPLLVVIYFAIMLRGPVEGTLTGMVIGLVQDAQTGHPIGCERYGEVDHRLRGGFHRRCASTWRTRSRGCC